MDEEDMDFTPSQNTSSNLASLFDCNKKSLQGNPSLTYTPPKAPKRESSPAKKESFEEKLAKSVIILSDAVMTFKLEAQNYVKQGLSGLVISGNHESHSYEIILYKPSKEHLTKMKISRNFDLTVSPNNYASFFDSNKINWCMKFQSLKDIEQFATKIAICKFFAQEQPLKSILIQDLHPMSHQIANSSNTVDIVFSSYHLSPEGPSKFKEGTKERIKLSNYAFSPLSEGLIGCSEKCKRVIIVPHSLVGSWLDESNPNTDVMLEVKLEKILPNNNSLNQSKALEKGSESPLASSTEETNIKARGASIKETLGTIKSQKASLISRMARMGQATLPMWQSGPSDSEEENISTASPKPRLPRNRCTGNNSNLHQNISQTSSTEDSETQQVSIYQNDLSRQQSQLAKIGVTYQQLIPVSSSSVSTPNNEPNLSIYVSESRIQAAELRMGISKISEKLDLVWDKLQNLNASSENKIHQSALLDSVGILKSIQTLITENEVLKAKAEEQKEKIEQQNDRIFQLLELNHKYLEQNSSSHEKQSESEVKLKAEVESLRIKELQWEDDIRKSFEKIKHLEETLNKEKEEKNRLAKQTEEFHLELEKYKKGVENVDSSSKELYKEDEKIVKAMEKVAELKEKLKEIVAENENLKSVITNLKLEMNSDKKEMGILKIKNEEFEKEVESLKKQMSKKESESASKIDELSQVLEKSKEKNEIQQIEDRDNAKEMKDLTIKLYSHMKEMFSPGKEYSTADILSDVEECFKKINSCLIHENEQPNNETVEDGGGKTSVVPAPRTTIRNTESGKKEVEKNENVNNSSDDSNEKKESDSRYKSYDQGWRTAKPPPPPLFDDEDDDDDWLN